MQIAAVPRAGFAGRGNKRLAAGARIGYAVAAESELDVDDLRPLLQLRHVILRAVEDAVCAEHEALVGHGAELVQLGVDLLFRVGLVTLVGLEPQQSLVGRQPGLEEIRPIEAEAGPDRGRLAVGADRARPEHGRRRLRVLKTQYLRKGS